MTLESAFVMVCVERQGVKVSKTHKTWKNKHAMPPVIVSVALTIAMITTSQHTSFMRVLFPYFAIASILCGIWLLWATHRSV